MRVVKGIFVNREFTPGWDAPKNGTFSVSGFLDIKFQNGRSFVCMDLHINDLETLLHESLWSVGYSKAHGFRGRRPFDIVFTSDKIFKYPLPLMNAPFQGKSSPAYLNDLSCSLIFSVYFDDFKTVDTSKNYRCVEIWSCFLPFSCTCLEKLNRSWLLHLLPRCNGEKRET